VSRTTGLIAVLIAALLVAACGGSNAGSSGEAPDFSATTLEEDEFSLSEKRGEVVALYFMAGY
jgi:major membrane immunogen (membrane-anchored lipoprotein)